MKRPTWRSPSVCSQSAAGAWSEGTEVPTPRALRLLVRKGGTEQTLDRLLVSALIEARSCERFAVLAAASTDAELAAFYKALCSSEMGHYKVFLKLANKVTDRAAVEARWQKMLAAEARILSEQPPGPRIHSGAGIVLE